MSLENIRRQVASHASWVDHFEPEQWSIYKRVISEAHKRGVRFAIGGGLAAMTYAGQWRDTKDIDLYILKRDRDELIDIVTSSGLQDYYDQKPYDRNWIYRSYRHDIIVDIIWAMANQRAQVDEAWLEGPEIETGGERFSLLRPEEMLWSKLYILQRDRCDWPDALSMLYTVGSDLDWRCVLARVSEDRPLLNALLSVFAWLCPDRARAVPSWLWDEIRIETSDAENCQEAAKLRAPLLDSRPWFTPTVGDIRHEQSIKES